MLSKIIPNKRSCKFLTRFFTKLNITDSGFKIMAIVFVIVFIFVFSKGIEVLTNTNSYKIPYGGPDKSAIEKWLPFTQKKSKD